MPLRMRNLTTSSGGSPQKILARPSASAWGRATCPGKSLCGLAAPGTATAGTLAALADATLGAACGDGALTRTRRPPPSGSGGGGAVAVAAAALKEPVELSAPPAVTGAVAAS